MSAPRAANAEFRIWNLESRFSRASLLSLRKAWPPWRVLGPRCPTSALRPLTSQKRKRSAAFTLLELLVVLGIISIMLVLLAPAFTTIKSGTDITTAAYTIRGILENARNYALINRTYTWVGFVEEDGSQPSTDPATVGTSKVGRVAICTVASNDGSTVYTSVASPAQDMDPNGTKLTQLGKLIKLDNVHLLQTFENGTGDGSDKFPGRPSIPSTSPESAQIGFSTPPDTLRYFHYPPTKTEANAQYKFYKMFQFSPRGECRPQNDNYPIRSIMEVAFQPIRGTVVDDNKKCAVQLTGFGGNIKIYQP